MSFVTCDMFMCVISNKDVYIWFVFDVIDLIKEVWIKFPVEVSITDEVSHWGI